jgi:hypothetical protein
LLTESEVSDNFGQHVGKTYFAIQVRVSNQNANYDFLLRDIMLTLPDGRLVSSRIRRFAQGVAVKGKTLDRRAKWFNSLSAAASLYGGLSIFASTGFLAAGNALQGAVLQGYGQIFPDYTTDNVNRFNTAVFDDQDPSIVPKDSIGQPPLYVVALVPKSGNVAADKRFGERIAVSLEGTFIKSVSVISLDSTSLTFTPQFLAVPAVTNAVSQDALVNTLLQGQTSQKITISNNNSSVMNISGISITTTTGATASNDFIIDTQRSTCGDHTTAVSWDPKVRFTIAAQTSCFVYVWSTPQSPGATKANLVVQGDSLDGPTTVALEGTGVGVMVDFAGAASGGVKLPTAASLKCAYADSQTAAGCSIDLGNIGTGAKTVSLPIYYYMASGGTANPITIAQGGQTVLASCNDKEVPAIRDVTANCAASLTLAAGSTNTVVTLTPATGTKTTFTVKYVLAAPVPPQAVMVNGTKLTGIAANAAVPTTVTVQVAPAPPGGFCTGTLALPSPPPAGLTFTPPQPPALAGGATTFSVTAVPGTNTNFDAKYNGDGNCGANTLTIPVSTP